MKKYIVDTNVFLRFILRDYEKYYQIAKGYFTQAKQGRIVLVLIPEVILEIDYVLRGVYSLPREKSAEYLAVFVKSPYFQIQERDILIEAIEKYERLNIDLTDLFIYETARSKEAEVLSFDKDFEKIKKL